MTFFRTLMLFAMIFVTTYCAGTDDPIHGRSGALQTAVTKGLDVVTKAAERYPDHQSCFSCHHQTLPMLAAVMARGRGIEIHETWLKGQKDFTHTSFADDLDALRAGRGIGGRSMTVGYGLWALRLADSPADETTEAMVTFLLKTQHDDGHWSRQTSRPPLEDSNIMCTALAIYGLQKYPADSQRADIEAAVARAAQWLSDAKLESQEDRCARLWSLSLLKASIEESGTVRSAIIAAQRDDGGWAQLDSMTSDAYATGQTLWLLQATGFDTTEPAYQRGVDYLLRSQCDDGSWFVSTRSKPVQPYFDNGDPHGKDQFISTPATCWAVAALAAAINPSERNGR